MLVERWIKVEAMFCSACGVKLSKTNQCGVYLGKEDIYCLCCDCDLQISDLIEMLGLSAGIIRNGGGKIYGKKNVDTGG